MLITIIIPTFQESVFLGATLQHLLDHAQFHQIEIIVCDGGSTDDTAKIAAAFPVTFLTAPIKGRAAQMNYAAAHAHGDLLFFVHADCLPPKDYAEAILLAIRNGADAGCFRYRFDKQGLMLRVNAFFNRFSGILFRGGDQTLFIKHTVFQSLQGFNEHFVVMEDYDMVRRIHRHHRFVVLPHEAVVSARKYEQNSWLKVNFANAVAMTMFLTGRYQPVDIRNTYHRLIKHPKGR